MLHATLNGYTVNPQLHQDHVACIANACVMADWLVKNLLKISAALILPVNTLCDG